MSNNSNDEKAYIKGRGAQIKTENKYLKHHYDYNTWDWSNEEPETGEQPTQYIQDYPKTIVNKVTSPDIGPAWSMNPYQGCEHGCIYCYARPTHEYWGYSAGLDFEQKILFKPQAPDLLRQKFDHPKWQPEPIMLAGNTDCYQPAERKFKITRALLEVFRAYNHPVGIITKSALVLRDIDLLQSLAADNLVHVHISITSADENLRKLLEPRTAAANTRFKVVETLAKAGVQVGVMAAPIIPALNDHEIPEIARRAAEAGACSINYTYVRLNGKIGEIFEDWIRKNMPDRADRVLNWIKRSHDGKLNDSRFGVRMRGEGKMADTINQLIKISRVKYFAGRGFLPYNYTLFKRPEKGQLSLF